MSAGVKLTPQEEVVLAHWKNVAAQARAAGMTELAEHADHHAALLENKRDGAP